MSVRIFAINDCEWWAGDCTEEDILQAYMNATGMTHAEATGDITIWPRALTDLETEQLWYGIDDAGNPLPAPITYKERLARCIARGDRFPAPFAAIEW